MNKAVNIGAISSAHITKDLAEMLSGSEALLIFRDLISFNVPSVEKAICDRPRENQPSSHLGMIVEIPVLKFVISITSFCSC